MSRDDDETENHCKCHKISGFIHELAQSLMIINTYINGCQQRIRLNTLTDDQLLVIIDSIRVQTELISTKSQCLTNTSWLID